MSGAFVDLALLATLHWLVSGDAVNGEAWETSQESASSQAREVATMWILEGLFCKDGSSASLEGDDTGNVKLYSVSAAMFQPYWEAPGQVVELKDNEGSQIFVKGLVEGDKKKTLVKKVKNKNNGKEISSWIVELGGRDSEQENSLAESLSEVSGLGLSTSVSKKLRSPSTVDEWKTIADIKMNEAVAWKKRLGLEDHNREPSPSSSEVSASDQDVFLSSQDTQCSSSVRNLRLVNRIGDAISAEHRIRDTKGKSDLSLEISNSSGTTRNSLATSRKPRVESQPNTAKRQGRYSLGKVIDPENNKFNLKEELKKATSRHRHGP